ncbi:MAG: hypothetical protein AAF944_27465 [Bacteroidota bacterium]
MKISVKIIHPVDPSTDFLLSISRSLEIIKSIDLEIIRPNVGEAINDFSSLRNCDTILFLGHGYSRYLYGGVSESGKAKLINIEQAAALFSQKQAVLFACDSNEFLKEVNRTNIVTSNYMGFGNMPTDWSDIIGIRESDPFFKIDLEEQTLEKYKELIVTSLSESLQLFFARSLSFRDLYLELRLRINKQINATVYSSELDKAQKRELIKMLVEHRDEISWN